MAALALMNVVSACAAMIVLAGGVFFTATAAALVFVFATVVFDVGEVLQGPVQDALVADLSVERLRGRYFALSSMSWSLGLALGPCRRRAGARLALVSRLAARSNRVPVRGAGLSRARAAPAG